LPDKTVRTIKAQAQTLRDAKGNPLRLTGVNYDITESKRTEEALSIVHKLESLGILAGGIAHDFNNLMGGIFGYIDMACEESKDDQVTRYLSKAMNTIDRARGLTSQLLTFAKGGAPIQKTGPLFPFVQETAQFALSGSNISCQFSVPQDLWVCNFDKNQIGQVIDNLIINAQQAMPAGGAIEVMARNVALSDKEHPALAPGNYIKISVKDYGIGIPKELLSKIFDPFFTTKTKGHGLGLATCYSIVNRHGGCIDVASELGKGTTFHVYVPASPDAGAPLAAALETGHKGTGTFLVMDDEVVMRETIRDMLASLGYTVVCTESGREAVDFFMAETTVKRMLSGMIFDLTVPGGMGGKAAVAEIRKVNGEIPVFVASGYAEDPIMKSPTEYGFTASICKPFTKAELSVLLTKSVKAKSRS
jgi:nitrogen-specific signal transduction histidine kinase/CheY-like chemotaxis protein